MLNCQGLAIGGVPDIIGCIQGRFFALECKRSPQAKRARLQVYMQEKIQKAGGFCEFIYPENMLEILEKLDTYIKSPTIQ